MESHLEGEGERTVCGSVLQKMPGVTRHKFRGMFVKMLPALTHLWTGMIQGIFCFAIQYFTTYCDQIQVSHKGVVVSVWGE